MEKMLNELFQLVDRKLQETSTSIQQNYINVTQIVGEIESSKTSIHDKAERIETIRNDIPQRLHEIMQETKEFVSSTTGPLQPGYNDAHQGFLKLQMQVEGFKADINRVSTAVGSGGTSGAKKRSLVDVKSFEIKTLDGDTETQSSIDERREDVEEYLNTFFASIKYVMEKGSKMDV